MVQLRLVIQQTVSWGISVSPIEKHLISGLELSLINLLRVTDQKCLMDKRK